MQWGSRLGRKALVVITALSSGALLTHCVSVERAPLDETGDETSVETGEETGEETGDETAPETGDETTVETPEPECADADPITCNAADDGLVICVDSVWVDDPCPEMHGCFDGACEPLLDCQQLTECYFGCDPSHGALALVECQSACLGHATEEASAEFTEVFACLEDECADPADSDQELCVYLECPEVVLECAYGTDGTSTCVELVSCFEPCTSMGDEDAAAQCSLDCLRDAHPEAQLLFLEVQLCIAAACDGNVADELCWIRETQFRGFCSTEWLACQADK